MGVLMTSSLPAKIALPTQGEQYDMAEWSQRTNPAYWRKSRSSGGGGCVEVAMSSGSVQVRDSKNPGGSALEFTGAEWASFVIGVQHDEFDRHRCVD